MSLVVMSVLQNLQNITQKCVKYLNCKGCSALWVNAKLLILQQNFISIDRLRLIVIFHGNYKVLM